LVGFKKGAFAGLKTVQPIIVKYKWKSVAPTWEGIPFIQHTHILCSSFEGIEVELYRLPPFKPNDYLFETHKEQGKEKWEVFAWAVRQAMAEHGGFKLTDQTNYDKCQYKDFMRGK